MFLPWRAFTSATEPSRTFRPRSISATRSHSFSTVSIWCDESTIVAPLRRRSSIVSRITSMPTGSSPLVGSSMISTSGSWSTVAMNCAFCCMPFDSSFVFFLRHSARPMRSSQGPSRRWASARPTPLIAARKTSCSSRTMRG